MRREIVIDPADLRCRHLLRLAGTICRVATNSRDLATGLARWIAPDPEPAAGSVCMQVLVRPGQGSAGQTPHFRGMKHLVFASFGDDNFFVLDRARRQITATVSDETAIDQPFWDRILLPIAIGVLGPAVGVLPIHAACMAADGMGALIGGASGAGKSTLSVALAQNGFEYISDDWSYLSVERDGLLAHGMEVPAKLLPNAIEHFPFLSQHPLRMALNQELAYEVSAKDLGAQIGSSCEPRWFILLERSLQDGCRIQPLDRNAVHAYLEQHLERLPPELATMQHLRSGIARQVADLSCWQLTYGGPPAIAVSGLQTFFAQQRLGVFA
jgi:hypothetical protein